MNDNNNNSIFGNSSVNPEANNTVSNTPVQGVATPVAPAQAAPAQVVSTPVAPIQSAPVQGVSTADAQTQAVQDVTSNQGQVAEQTDDAKKEDEELIKDKKGTTRFIIIIFIILIAFVIALPFINDFLG